MSALTGAAFVAGVGAWMRLGWVVSWGCAREADEDGP